jgi:deazaflavin-dependent oxidoreductase (nitroreductase family)
MSFDTRAGTRGGWQPGTGGPIGRWYTKRIANRIRRTGKLMGLHALVLTTIGRKSGAERTTPVMGWLPDDGGAWLIVAAANGGAKNPAWYFNIAAHPDKVQIETPGRTVGDRRAAPRERARRGMAADRRRFAPVCEVPAEDRPRAADHPPHAAARVSTPAKVEHSRHCHCWTHARPPDQIHRSARAPPGTTGLASPANRWLGNARRWDFEAHVESQSCAKTDRNRRRGVRGRSLEMPNLQAIAALAEDPRFLKIVVSPGLRPGLASSRSARVLGDGTGRAGLGLSDSVRERAADVVRRVSCLRGRHHPSVTERPRVDPSQNPGCIESVLPAGGCPPAPRRGERYDQGAG